MDSSCRESIASSAAPRHDMQTVLRRGEAVALLVVARIRDNCAVFAEGGSLDDALERREARIVQILMRRGGST